jgi:hypothetical protein
VSDLTLQPILDLNQTIEMFSSQPTPGETSTYSGGRAGGHELVSSASILSVICAKFEVTLQVAVCLWFDHMIACGFCAASALNKIWTGSGLSLDLLVRMLKSSLVVTVGWNLAAINELFLECGVHPSIALLTIRQLGLLD